MKPFTILQSNICPLDMSNIDTDQIIPKQFLKRIEKSGFGEFLFYDWRYKQTSPLVEDTEFPLNKKKYKNAKILLSRKNFGCGSSREHAPWSLLDYGFKCIIAESFADIFYNNCFQNGILPLQLSSEQIDTLFQIAEEEPSVIITVDLNTQKISIPEESNLTNEFHFLIDTEKKEKLIKGLDDIAITLQYYKEIEEYEKTL